MKSSASIATLAPALVKALAEIGGVAKGKTNPAFKSKYATLESVIEASKGILASHGIALMQFPSAFSGGAMSLDTVLLHESGEWLSGEEAFGVATSKSDPQAVGSALTYARRYAQMAVLNMPAVDDDANAATFSTSTISQDQADDLRVEIEAVGADTGKFLAFFKVSKLEALPAGRWNEAVAMLEAKRMKEAA